MRPPRPRPRRESSIVDELVLALHSAGWLVVDKTHGGRFSRGWPDLFCWRPQREGHRHRGFDCRFEGDDVCWVEVKRPTGKLERAQVERFSRWEAAGLGVWILTSGDLSPLDGPPNWRSFLR